MILKYKYKKLTWIDLECPTQEELRQIMNEWAIDPIIAQELVGPSVRPKVDLFPNFIYLIFHLPVSRRIGSKRQIEQQEIDFIIGKNFIITSRYDAIDPLHQFSRLFEVNSILDKSDMGDHAGFVFFYMIRSIYDSMLHHLESIGDTIRTIEESVFNGKEREMVIRLSEVSRELLDIKRAINLHKEILESFDSASRRFFGDDFSYHNRAIIGEYYKVATALQNSFESVTELRETNNSLLNTRENETMKIITVIAFVTLPATLVSNLFDIGANGTPIVNEQYGWLIIMSLIFSSTLFLFIFAKIKKWF